MCERAVRMGQEIRRETGEKHGTLIARELGIGAESLRYWLNQAEVDSGRRPGTSTEDAQRIVVLEREVKELHQADLAKRAGVPQSFVSSYENGRRRLDLAELDQLARALQRLRGLSLAGQWRFCSG